MAPPQLPFAYELPHISQRKLALIKLVAQYAVLDPVVVEKRRHQFEFMDSENSLNQLYVSFVNQYKLIVDGCAPKDVQTLVSRAIDRAAETLDKSTQSLNQPLRALTTSSELSDKQPEPLQVYDWQDFVVVETVEFSAADMNATSVLAAPISESEIQLEKLSASPFSDLLVRSEITGETLPAAQYNEHMRIHNIDPSYYEQKAKEQKRSESNLDYANAADNLKLLQQKRQKLKESLYQ